MTSREQLARAAGIYSGEGGIYCYDKPKTYMCLKVQQNECSWEPEGCPSILVQFHEAVGLGEIKGPYHRTRWPTWLYIASQDDAATVFEKIKPWLTVAKQRQGEAALATWSAIKRRHRWGTATEYPCGHARTPENTLSSGTNPHCRECKRARSAARNRRIAAERQALKADQGHVAEVT